MVDRHPASECLREPLVDTLPMQCRQLKKAFGECRRGMVDMRKRFRGNMPVTYRTLESADKSSGSGYQLYGGQVAFNSGARETDGNEPVEPDWREVENEKYRLERQRQYEAQQKK